MNFVDVLILIPLVPVAPIAVTWWLPWERWIPWGELPKDWLGLYLLYAAFAAWHFRLGLWLILALALTGEVLLLVYVYREVEQQKGNSLRNRGNEDKPN